MRSIIIGFGLLIFCLLVFRSKLYARPCEAGGGRGCLVFFFIGQYFNLFNLGM